VFEKIWIPDVFTPNGDGFNDTWELTNITAYPNAEVRVFNRWGEIAYYSYGSYGGFDGTYNGNVLPMGSYTYHIIPFPDHPELEFKGTLADFLNKTGVNLITNIAPFIYLRKFLTYLA
jgi:gliding motility-associated-like protein